jgi:hypothetical protein
MVHARNRVLLPSLNALTLHVTSGSGDQTMWIRAFLSPSLTDIDIIGSSSYVPLLSYSESSTLFRYITGSCPDLKRLSLFPDSDTLDSSNETHRAVVDFWDSDFSCHLGEMRSLHRLTSTTVVLMPDALGNLASLPGLERLFIYPASSPLTVVGPAAKGSFPTLKHFGLFAFSHTLFANVWRLGFFTHLTSLELGFTTRPDSDVTEGLQWISRLMPLICNACPDLSKLSIDFGVSFSTGYEKVVVVGFASVLHPMRELPLQELSLIGVSLDDHDTKIHSLIPTVWTKLTILNMPDEMGSAQSLYWFSELPNLKRLIMYLYLTVPAPEFAHRSITNHCLEILESSHQANIIGDITQIARYGFPPCLLFDCSCSHANPLDSWLLSLWPTLQKVGWVNDEDEAEAMSAADSKTLASGLNGVIILLREVNEMKLRISQEHVPMF